MSTQDSAVNSTPGIEVAVLSPDEGNFNRVHVQPRSAYAPQAGFVMQLVQVCAGPQPDGVTASGHQAFRSPSPGEAVERAFAIADGVFAELERRGWSAALPPLDELRSAGEAVGFLARAGRK